MHLALQKPEESFSVEYVTGFMHKVKVSNSVISARQKIRILPFSVRTAVSAELSRLLSTGITE